MRAILGQQISVAAARTLIGRIVARFGETIGEFPNGEPMSLFPPAGALAEQDLTSIGLTKKRAACLQGFAAAVACGALNFDELLDAESLMTAVQTLPGIGPWTAEYVAMRALAEPDAFPTADLGLLRATGLNAKELQQRAETWRPWRAYAAIHLWNA